MSMSGPKRENILEIYHVDMRSQRIWDTNWDTIDTKWNKKIFIAGKSGQSYTK